MTKSVHLKKMFSNRYMLSLAAGILLALTGSAQTYTTKADGNWSSPATWVGGVVPSASIGAGKVVNIQHGVTFNVNSDLTIAGTLNVTDTLTFTGGFSKKVKVNGLLNVNGGGFLQAVADKSSDMEIDNGRVVFNNAYVSLSKGFLSKKKAIRTIINSKLYIGGIYSLDGSGGANASIDTVKNSLIETNLAESGALEVTKDGTLRVANACFRVMNNNNFVNDGTISVLTGAQSNYGFDLLKVTGDLENKSTWVARIDAACIGGTIKGSQMAAIDFTRAQDCGMAPTIGNAPELVFKNPVLKQGQAKKQGAVYRFANVMTGVDAEIKLKKFSRNDIVMQDIDLPSMGWDKAFQPQFGLAGLVQPNQNWYIDFEMKFYKAGTNTQTTLPKVDMTALDVDGDGLSVREYAIFQNPANVMYSTINYLSEQPAGVNGQTFTCPIDGLISPLLPCLVCGGDGKGGLWNLTDCAVCDATGLIFTLCNHGFDGTNGSTLEGPVENFFNIDTAATQVMATYQYTDVNFIAFRYGAKSGAQASNGAGVRLNSLWFRQFNLSPPSILPVKLTGFNAVLNKKDVQLNWTGHEENFSHYVLQRSTNGKDYNDIAIIFSADNTGDAKSYSYKDANVSSPTNTVFYRLHLVDNVKETGKYSDVRVIKLAKETEAIALTTYPNPVVNQVRVTLPSQWQGKPVMVELFTSNGTRVHGMQSGSASQTENIDMTKLTKGMYVVKVTCNGETAQQRIIKN